MNKHYQYGISKNYWELMPKWEKLLFERISLFLKNSYLDDIENKSNKKERYNYKGLIMVVDDSITVRKCMRKFLKKNNYAVISAFDGEDAKSKIINVMPDLILLDVEMPKMDGFEFAQYVKESEKLKHIPIIMITSKTAEKHKNKAIKIGIEDYQAKPFNEKKLLSSLRSFLD